MRTFLLLLGLTSGAVIGLALAHWLGFELLAPADQGGGAIAAAAGGLGAGIGLALARSSNRRRHDGDTD